MTANALAPPPQGINLSPGAAQPRQILERQLRLARSRILGQRLLDWLAACLLAAAAIVLVAAAIAELRGHSPWQREWLLAAAGAAAVTAVTGTAAGWMNLAQTAQRIDARGATHDRFHTALAFSARNSAAPFEALTLAECGRFIERFPVRQWTPLRWPRAARYLAVPAVSLALLCWHASLRIGGPPPAPALDAAVDRRAVALEMLADRLRHDPEQAKSPELEKLAAEMKAAAQRLHDGADRDASTKLKAALGELSSLEAMLEAMKQAAQNPAPSPAELAALAAALAASEQTRAAAESLQQGQLEKAAGQLEAMLQQLKAQGSEEQTLAQLAQSMQEQSAKLTEAEKNEVARQMEAAAQGAQSGQTQLSEQAMQRLAELLRRAAGNNGGAGSQASSGSSAKGRPMTQRELQNLLNALENMKAGLQPGEGAGSGSPNDGEAGSERSLSLVESFANQNKSDQPGTGERPSGLPGTEHDEGHDAKLFDDTPRPGDLAKRSGPASRIEGMLGDGQSLQELVGANGDRSKASQPYRDLYQALAPAAQDAIEQEDIPLGSRPFIRQYFENIRP